MQPYDEEMYKNRHKTTLSSAQEIVPLVLDLIQPSSVIDIGCGVGTWLSVFKELGVNHVFGVDGDWVDKSLLQIPEDCFMSFDLRNPMRLEKKFDLVVSLEVAEHFPEELSENFVNILISLGPVILFSAAIPYQVGKIHLNEQWPDYWAKLFEKKGYLIVDCLRSKIWNNNNILYWYAQNMFIYAQEDYLSNNKLLKEEFSKNNNAQLSLVHPTLYTMYAKYLHHLWKIYLLLPSWVRRKFRRE